MLNRITGHKQFDIQVGAITKVPDVPNGNIVDNTIHGRLLTRSSNYRELGWFSNIPTHIKSKINELAYEKYILYSIFVLGKYSRVTGIRRQIGWILTTAPPNYKLIATSVADNAKRNSKVVDICCEILCNEFSPIPEKIKAERYINPNRAPRQHRDPEFDKVRFGVQMKKRTINN